MTRASCAGATDAPGAMSGAETIAAADYPMTMSERELQDAVIELAEAWGWVCWHDADSRKNDAGWPDLVCIPPPAIAETGQGVIFAELKAERGYVRREQRRYLVALRQAGAQVEVWRPRHWISGDVARALHVEDWDADRH